MQFQCFHDGQLADFLVKILTKEKSLSPPYVCMEMMTVQVSVLLTNFLQHRLARHHVTSPMATLIT